MKKVSSILFVLIIFNFIFSSFVYADITIDNTDITYSEDSFNELVNNGTVSKDGTKEQVSETTSSTASSVGTGASAGASGFLAATTLLRVFANGGGFYRTLSECSAEKTGWFTVNSLVFGEYLVFNADITKTCDSLNPDIEPSGISKQIDGIKTGVSKIFIIARRISLAFILLLLLYTGIKYFISEMAEEKARLKEALKAWVSGLAFILLVPYIMMAVNWASEAILDNLYSARISLEESGYSSFESNLFVRTLNGVASTGGLQSAAFVVEFIAFVITDFVFAWKYLVRLFKVVFLILASPVYAILHIFNKLSGKNGRIGQWLHWYISNIAMQPLHAFLYLVFMFMASEIVNNMNTPLLAIVFLWALLRSEKIFKILLNLDYGKITEMFSK